MPSLRLLRKFALTENRFNARDVFFANDHLHGVIELTRSVAESKVEKLLFELTELSDKLVVFHFVYLLSFHYAFSSLSADISSPRLQILQRTGNL